MFFDIDDNATTYRPLSTPPLSSPNATRKLFNFFQEDRYDFLTDLVEVPDQSEKIGQYDISINQSSHIAKDSFDYQAIHQPGSYPEPDDNQSSHVSHPQESLNLERLIGQDAVLRKMYPLKLPEFLRLLLDNECYALYLSWLNRNEGLFKIHEPVQVANLWRRVKARKIDEALDYDNFARGIRYYYKTGVMLKTNTKQTYRFAHV